MKLIYPDWFRKEASDYALKKVKYGDSYLIIGIPGVGKSTFLKILYERLKDKEGFPPVVFCDLNDVSPVTEEATLNYLLEKASTELKRDVDDFQEFNAVFIVDRFEKPTQALPTTFFDKLRFIREESDHETIFILSSDKELTSIRSLDDISQFYTPISAHTYYLKPLNEREAKHYLVEYSQRRDLNFSESQVDDIVAYAGGHPRLINAYILYLSRNENRKFKEAINEAGSSEAVIYQCQRILEQLTEPEKRALQRLTANLDLSLIDKEALKHLIKLGIIDDSNKFFGKRFEDFISQTSPRSKIPIYLDEITGEIFKHGKRMDQNLSAQEYKFVRHLIENTDRIVPRDELIEAAWGAKQEEGVSDEAVDQLVSRLREKIEDKPSEPKHIITIRGRGFQFKLG